jgi:hypothetical protein
MNRSPSFRRIWQAFIQALRLTLRGETLGSPQPPIVQWQREYVLRVEAVRKAADQSGLGAAARADLKLKLDGRSMSIETILGTLHFHANQEIPMLLSQGTQQRSLNAVYAMNMNDRFWVSRLMESPGLQQPALQTALALLDKHLAEVPRAEAA